MEPSCAGDLQILSESNALVTICYICRHFDRTTRISVRPFSHLGLPQHSNEQLPPISNPLRAQDHARANEHHSRRIGFSRSREPESRTSAVPRIDAHRSRHNEARGCALSGCSQEPEGLQRTSFWISQPEEERRPDCFEVHQREVRQYHLVRDRHSEKDDQNYAGRRTAEMTEYSGRISESV